MQLAKVFFFIFLLLNNFVIVAFRQTKANCSRFANSISDVNWTDTRTLISNFRVRVAKGFFLFFLIVKCFQNCAFLLSKANLSEFAESIDNVNCSRTSIISSNVE